jgi:DNA (cytosine-5)-methyltransferase 1
VDPFRPHTYIDLFAGCGGISLGLHNAGWRGIFAIEKSAMAFETLKHNLIDNEHAFDWPQWLPVTEHDIVEVLKNQGRELKGLRGAVDLVAGGPPCQGFSTAGRRIERDKRNKLVRSYVKVIDLVRPRALFFENVKGFTIGFKKSGSGGRAYSSRVSMELERLGYKVKDEIVDFSDFGVPQTRKRYILVGMLSGDPDGFFVRLTKLRRGFLRAKGFGPKVSVWEAISDLERRNGERDLTRSGSFKEGLYGRVESPYQQWMRKGGDGFPDSHRFANHRKKTVERFMYILRNCPGGKRVGDETRSKLKIKKKTVILLHRDSPCPTLTTLPDDCIHYSEPRILTVREYARIQSFNDWFEFKAKYTTGGKSRRIEIPRYTQAGNAVPPLFAELSGLALRTMA